MPGSSTTPGRPGTRAHAPVRIAFHLRNSVDTRDMNLCGAQWLACVLPYRRFATTLTDGHARLGADVDRYSVITSDFHRLLVAGLPAHCEKLWTLPSSTFRAATGLLRFARNDKEQIKKPRGKPRGFLLSIHEEEFSLRMILSENRKTTFRDHALIRSWQAWQRPTLPSLET